MSALFEAVAFYGAVAFLVLDAAIFLGAFLSLTEKSEDRAYYQFWTVVGIVSGTLLMLGLGALLQAFASGQMRTIISTALLINTVGLGLLGIGVVIIIVFAIRMWFELEAGAKIGESEDEPPDEDSPD